MDDNKQSAMEALFESYPPHARMPQIPVIGIPPHMPLSKVLCIYASAAKNVSVGYMQSGTDLVIAIETKENAAPIMMRLLHKDSVAAAAPIVGLNRRVTWVSYEESAELPAPRSDVWVFVKP